jgi:hypothetical protein
MVHPEDIADGRLEALLKDMTSRARNLLPGVEFQWFTCSACRSTYPADSGRKLKGRPIYDNPERKTFEYEVPELPEYWPDEWHAGDFHFSKVYPHAPKNLSKPPAHINLDRVFKFITE